ncbi:hypothetical protein OG413_41095 [Streptomyces sp. NBC_01433]|uniref:hypothetical protein n=1 Tax=Streptomyces sp. NBC_01433 TaxID=2903864 RepID=UPI00225479F3|nr:hypothetical protein [Streptomyces sp. NBC_01433]MCX4681601.1 hypothetical protein [Streptomyces sp. NBC_01433]
MTANQKLAFAASVRSLADAGRAHEAMTRCRRSSWRTGDATVDGHTAVEELLVGGQIVQVQYGCVVEHRREPGGEGALAGSRVGRRRRSASPGH